MNLIVKWILLSLLIIFIAWIVPGISISGFLSAMFVVVIVAIINVLIKPLVELISLPINFITLGLFGFVINALLFLLAGKLAPGFVVDGFWSALFGSILLSVMTPLINKIEIKK